MVRQLMQRSHSTQVKMLHEDAGTHFRNTVGVSQDFVAMEDAELSDGAAFYALLNGDGPRSPGQFGSFGVR